MIEIPGLDESAPELAAILRMGNPDRCRRAQLVCTRGNDRFAQIFTSPAGLILLGRGLLATEDGDQQRAGYIVRYLDREPRGAAVSLQCRCGEHHRPVLWLIEQQGRVPCPPRLHA